jgi:hypothetical protein
MVPFRPQTVSLLPAACAAILAALPGCCKEVPHFKKIASFSGTSVSCSFSYPRGGFALVLGFKTPARTSAPVNGSLDVYRSGVKVHSTAITSDRLIECNYLDHEGSTGSIIHEDYEYQDRTFKEGDPCEIRITLDREIPEADSLWLHWLSGW